RPLLPGQPLIGVSEAVPPSQPLYRIGYLPDPLAWPPLQYVGSGRFDDPVRRFCTLYAAEQRLGCFVESLARYRPSPRALVELRNVTGAPDPSLVPVVPGDWWVRRRVGRFYLDPDQKWLDLRTLGTREALRVELADTILRLGLTDLDVSSVRSLNRDLTHAMARWAYEHGYNGVAYTSRFDDGLDCWRSSRGLSSGRWAPQR
ncbi:MAG: RES domain-containing protein, partial [bacterium]|nr:RES domain-containing protein [bacterium]